MIVTVEISLYPLHQDYEQRVISFINSLKEHKGLQVLTNSMSTYIKGELDVLWPALQEELEKLYTHDRDNSCVLKIIPQDFPIDEGFLDFS